jgi:hypothetical protein
MGKIDLNVVGEQIPKLLTTVFSSIVLTALAVIISGKLLASRIPLGFSKSDRFGVNLGVLNLKAIGDEASLGLLMFLGSLAFVGGVFGASDTSTYLSGRTGLTLSAWDGLCFGSSLFSAFCAVTFYVVFPFIWPKSIITSAERDAQIASLSEPDN